MPLDQRLKGQVRLVTSPQWCLRPPERISRHQEQTTQRPADAGISNPATRKETIIMLRKMSLVFGLCILASLSAQAQDKVEVFGGYSYLRFRTSPSTNLNGWEISGQYKFTDWLGGVAEIYRRFGSFTGVSTSSYKHRLGPQSSWPPRVPPRVHLLLGGAPYINP